MPKTQKPGASHFSPSTKNDFAGRVKMRLSENLNSMGLIALYKALQTPNV